jgi:hypothetical protein
MHCIPKYVVEEFLDKIKKGELTPQMLINMTSEQRIKAFEDIFGMENSKDINYLFEQKMLLKNQIKGIVNWAKKIKDINEVTRRDILAKANRLDKYLTPQEQKDFFSDLIEHRLGVAVTMDEAKTISLLAKKFREAKTVDEKVLAEYDFKTYTDGLKLNENPQFKEWYKPKNWGKDVVEVAGIIKGIKASFDMSALLRQGLKVLVTHPKIWAKNSKQSFLDVIESLKTENGADEVARACALEIMKRENYQNGLYKKYKLALGVYEEEFPSTLPEKIPFFRRLYKASENAFSLFMYRTRADLFDLLHSTAEKNGVSSEGLGVFVNSLTGRGDLGFAEPVAKAVNNVFFSPRFLKSNIDILTMGVLNKNRSSFVKKEAAKASLSYIGMVSLALLIANAFDDDKVEEDPRSSDFGKLRVGNARFDMTGGVGNLVVLLSRLITKSTKSSTTGIVRDLGTGVGQQSVGDVFVNFVEGKLSPAAHLLLDFYRGYDFSGKPVDAKYLAMSGLLPIPFQNAIEHFNEEELSIYLAGIVADAFGVGTYIYAPREDWNTKKTKEMNELKASVGQERFDELNKRFNDEWAYFIKETRFSEAYKNMSDEDKIKYIRKEKSRIKKKVLTRAHLKNRK